MAWTVFHRVFALGGINISQRVYSDATDDLPAHVAILSADAGALGCSYAACGAGADTAVKASPGLLKGLTATGTGTTGTVALKDGSTTIQTWTLPATAGVYPLGAGFIPPEGITFGTNIHVVTSGTGITAAAAYL